MTWPGIIHVIWSSSPYVCSTLWSFTPNDMDDTGPGGEVDFEEFRAGMTKAGMNVSEEVGLGRKCSKDPSTHFKPSFLELNTNLRCFEHFLPGPARRRRGRSSTPPTWTEARAGVYTITSPPFSSTAQPVGVYSLCTSPLFSSTAQQLIS